MVKCKHPLIFFCTKLCKSFSWVRCSFPDYFDQLKCVPNRGEFSVFSSVGRGNLGNYSKPRKTFTQFCAEKYEGIFALNRKVQRGYIFQKLFLHEFFLYKQKRDGYIWSHCCMNNLYITHISPYAPTYNFRIICSMRISLFRIISWFDTVCNIL